MEIILKQKKFNAGQLTLREFWTATPQKPVRFVNNLGIIRESDILFRDHDLRLELAAIAAIRVLARKKRFTVPAFSLIAVAIAMALTPMMGTMAGAAGIAVVLLAGVFLLFFSHKTYQLQVILCRAEQKFIPLDRGRLDDAFELINKFNKWRYENPEI